MASESTESASIDCWSAVTNWIVTGGSLEASIVYDTSTDDPPAAVGGAVLIAPPSQDSPACEIIVSFKKKHDIHMVYVRSTARTYELYYGTDQQSYSKEYLCTVRCSAVATEGTPDATMGVTTESPNRNDRTMEIPEQPVQADSHSSDEDGWVEVKVPDSSVQHGQVNLVSKDHVGSSCSNIEIQYEATAEISDATPVVTLTLRLLSLQSKTCVHIEEIYIYSDPVESTNSDPPASMGGNMGANLLAMLAPGLIQIPKFGTSRIDKRLDIESDDSRMHENQHVMGKPFEASSSDIGFTRQEEAYSNIKDPKVGLCQEPTQIQKESTQLRASQKVMDADALPEPVTDESRVAYTCVEKVLDELVSRVGRIEAFCSRFEENMMKPLVCIDSRLQRLEQQLDAFSLKDHTSEPVPCFRVAAPEVSFPESDLENRDCNTKYTGQDDTCSHGASSPAHITASHDSQMCPGFVVKAPEFSSEADKCMHSSDTPDSVAIDCSSNSIFVSVKHTFSSVPESQMLPFLAVKAPEFVSEDDESDDDFEDDESVDSIDSPVTDHSGDKTCVNYFEDDESDDSLDSPVKNHSGDKTSCVDGAMASALEAFLTSTSVKCPRPIPMVALPELSNDKNSCLASSTRVPSEAEDICESRSSADAVAVPNNLFIELDVENSGRDVSEFGRENNGPVDSSLLATDKIIVASEFPFSHHDYIDCDDVSVSVTRNCLEDQAAGHGALMAFLSSKLAKSSKRDKTMLDSSLVPSNDRNNELASCTEVSFVEDDNSVRANHGNNIPKFNLDLVLGDLRYSTNESCFGGGDVTEDSDADEAAAEDSRLNLHWSFSSTDSSSNRVNHGNNIPKFNLDLVLGDLRYSTNESCFGGGDGTADSDADEAAAEDSRLNLHWSFSSTDSSSNCDLSKFDLASGLAAENGRSTRVEGSSKNYDNNTGSCKPCSERSVVEIEQALQSVGYFDPVVDLNGRSTDTLVGSINKNYDNNTGSFKPCSGYGCGGSIVEIEQALRSVGHFDLVGHFDPVDQVPHLADCCDLVIDLSGGSTLTSVESITNNNDYSECYCDPVLDLNGRSSQALAEGIISNNDYTRGSHDHYDYSNDRPAIGSELALWCLTDDYGSVLDLNLAPKSNLRSKVPLEGMMCGMYTGTAFVGNEGAMGSEQQQCEPSPFDSLDQKVRAGDQLLPGIDDVAVQLELRSGGDVQQGSGSSHQLPFISLI